MHVCMQPGRRLFVLGHSLTRPVDVGSQGSGSLFFPQASRRVGQKQHSNLSLRASARSWEADAVLSTAIGPHRDLGSSLTSARGKRTETSSTPSKKAKKDQERRPSLAIKARGEALGAGLGLLIPHAQDLRETTWRLRLNLARLVSLVATHVFSLLLDIERNRKARCGLGNCTCIWSAISGGIWRQRQATFPLCPDKRRRYGYDDEEGREQPSLSGIDSNRDRLEVKHLPLRANSKGYGILLEQQQ